MMFDLLGGFFSWLFVSICDAGVTLAQSLGLPVWDFSFVSNGSGDAPAIWGTIFSTIVACLPIKAMVSVFVLLASSLIAYTVICATVPKFARLVSSHSMGLHTFNSKLLALLTSLVPWLKG